MVSIKSIEQKQLYIVISLVFLSDLAIALDIPVLRQLLGLFFVFLPGYLIISILKPSGLSRLEVFILSSALSIAFLMFMGFVLNIFAYTIQSIYTPFSIASLAITLTACNLVLSVIAFKRGVLRILPVQQAYDACVSKLFCPAFFVILLILVLGVFGGLMTQLQGNTIVTLVLLGLIASTLVLVGFREFMPARFFPLLLLSIALALQYCHTLSSASIAGSDIHYEHLAQQLVQLSGYWDLSHYGGDTYSMLSVTVLPTILSVLLNMSSIWIYKWIFPLFFSLVPLTLYVIYKEQISDRTAFFSAFLFVAAAQFYTTMLNLPRQQVAELFLVVFVLLLLNNRMEHQKRTILSIIVIVSIVVSHYSIAVVFLFFLFILLLFSFASKRRETRITLSFVLLAFVIEFFWFLYIGQGGIFARIANIGSYTIGSFSTELFTVGVADKGVAAGLGLSQAQNILHQIGRYWVIVTEIFIVGGLIFTLSGRARKRWNPYFIYLSIASMGLLVLAIAIPAFSEVFNTDRIYTLTLMFLSPFCIVGIVKSVEVISSAFRRPELLNFNVKTTAIIVVLLPYFLFNSGFIFEITEHPSAFQLQFQPIKSNLEEGKTSTNWSTLALGATPEQEIYGAHWLSGKVPERPTVAGWKLVYGDAYRESEIADFGLIPSDLVGTLIADNTTSLRLSNGIYLFFGYQNVVDQTLIIWSPTTVRGIQQMNVSDLSPSIAQRDKIYANGGSAVYL